MRPSLPRLVRIIPRSQLKTELPSAVPARLIPTPHRSDAKQQSLIELLQKRKAQAGDDFPPNIRIEPLMNKKALKNVAPEIRQELKELLRER